MCRHEKDVLVQNIGTGKYDNNISFLHHFTKYISENCLIFFQNDG